jgi:nickel-dependent lactate racemase
VEIGKLENNPIHLEMLEAARTFAKGRTVFILNVIRNDKKQPVKVVAGDLEKAFYEGVRFAEKMFTVKVPALADAAIVSSGGYPKDLNFYQAQKSVTAASRVVRDGGTIVLLAECRDGVGQPVFERWLVGLPVEEIVNKKEHEIEVEGHRAFLTAKILNRLEVVVVSSMPASKIEELKFCSTDTLKSAIEGLRKKFGEDYKVYIIPNGAAIIPTVSNSK